MVSVKAASGPTRHLIDSADKSGHGKYRALAKSGRYCWWLNLATFAVFLTRIIRAGSNLARDR
jgi:hypothetical protein